MRRFHEVGLFDGAHEARLAMRSGGSMEKVYDSFRQSLGSLVPRLRRCVTEGSDIGPRVSLGCLVR